MFAKQTCVLALHLARLGGSKPDWLEVDPLVDFACHLLLGSPDHPQITIHFLNAILSPVQPITKVRILNPILGKDFDEDKLSILDILATDNLDRVFNVDFDWARFLRNSAAACSQTFEC